MTVETPLYSFCCPAPFMRVLVITQDFPPAVGGIETYASELVSRWAEQFGGVEVVAPQLSGAESVDAQLPLPVTRVSTRPDLLPVLGLAAIIRRARSLQPHVAFHTQWQTVGASLLARRLTGFPRRIVCAAHGRELLFNPADGIPLLKPAYDTLRRLLLRGPDVFTPVSRYTAGLLRERGVPDTRLCVVPNGTDPDRFHPQDVTDLRKSLNLIDDAVVITVGRLVPRKGIDTILQALPEVLDAVPSLTYLVVGTGPDRGRLEHLARDLGIRSHVRFMGHVSFEALPRYYNVADVFAMPSREAPPDVEGFGLVFLEAGACGVPVIGARTGGIPDAIQHEETGLLVPPSSPGALANALTRLLTTPDLARRLGENGRRHVVQEANWNHVANQLWDVLSTR